MSDYDYNDEFGIDEDDLLFLDDEFNDFLASLDTVVVTNDPELDEWEERAKESSLLVFDAICINAIENNISFQDVVENMMQYPPEFWPIDLKEVCDADVLLWQEKNAEHNIAHLVVSVALTTAVMTATGMMPNPFFPSDSNIGDDGHYTL